MKPGNELERLENIIAHDISCFMELNCSVNIDLLQDFKYAMLEETERIKSNHVARSEIVVLCIHGSNMHRSLPQCCGL